MSNEQVPLVTPTTTGGFEDEHKKKGRKGYLVYGVVATALCMGFVANSNGVFTPPEANLLRSSTSGCGGWCEGDRTIHSDTILCDPGSFMNGQCSSCGFCQSSDPPDTGDEIFAVCDNIWTPDATSSGYYGTGGRLDTFTKAAANPNKWAGVTLYAFQETKGDYNAWKSLVPELVNALPGGSTAWDSVGFDHDPYPNGGGKGDTDASAAWRLDTWTTVFKKAVKVQTDQYDKRSVVGACLENKNSGKKMFFASYHGSFPLNGSKQPDEQAHVFRFMDEHTANCGNNGMILADMNNSNPHSSNGWKRMDANNPNGSRSHGGIFGFDWGYSYGSGITVKSAEFKDQSGYTKSDHYPMEVKFNFSGGSSPTPTPTSCTPQGGDVYDHYPGRGEYKLACCQGLSEVNEGGPIRCR